MILDDELKTSSSFHNVVCQLNIPNISAGRNQPELILLSRNLDSRLYEPLLPMNMGREDKGKRIIEIGGQKTFQTEVL